MRPVGYPGACEYCPRNRFMPFAYLCQVLRRDNYRCIVTGRVDANAFVAGKIELQPGDYYTAVVNAHILPFSLMPGSEQRNVMS